MTRKKLLINVYETVRMIPRALYDGVIGPEGWGFFFHMLFWWTLILAFVGCFVGAVVTGLCRLCA